MRLSVLAASIALVVGTSSLALAVGERDPATPHGYDRQAAGP
jgi:hypothetical protein